MVEVLVSKIEADYRPVCLYCQNERPPDNGVCSACDGTGRAYETWTRQQLVAAVADGLDQVTEGRAGPHVTATATEEISRDIGVLMVKLKDAGHLPDDDVSEVCVGVHQRDPTQVVVTYPPGIQRLVAEASAVRLLRKLKGVG